MGFAVAGAKQSMVAKDAQRRTNQKLLRRAMPVLSSFLHIGFRLAWHYLGNSSGRLGLLHFLQVLRAERRRSRTGRSTTGCRHACGSVKPHRQWGAHSSSHKVNANLAMVEALHDCCVRYASVMVSDLVTRAARIRRRES